MVECVKTVVKIYSMKEELFNKNVKEKDYFMFMGILSVCVSVHQMHAVPTDARSGSMILGNWFYMLVSCHVVVRN